MNIFSVELGSVN